MKLILPVLLAFGQMALAKTAYYNWTVEWMTAAPDGFERAVIGINGEFPCPQIDVDVGDTVVVDLYNGLVNQSTSIHWHGIHQYGSNSMDGASGFTQCPIAPGQTFTYEFVVDQPGTYWYHSHNFAQYPDGLWGPLIVHDPNPPFHFDEEMTLTLLEWYHDEMVNLIHQYQSPSGEAYDGSPTPNLALINMGVDVKIPVKPNKTYFIRVICPGAYVGHAWVFDQHPMTTVEIDGVYTVPTEVNNDGQMVRIATGQRQGVLIQTKNDTSQNYAIFDTMDVNMLFINKGIIPPPADYNTNATAWLVYNDSAPLPPPPVFYVLDNSVFYDDLDYIPLDEEPLLGPVTQQIIVDINAANVSGISRFVLNNVTYLGQNVPTLYSALTVGEEYYDNPVVYGQTNPVIVQQGDIVEMVLNNLNTNLHPWHIHGHQFQVVERTLPKAGTWPGYYGNVSATPVRRDTVMLQDEGYAVIRFKADNPGVWAMHCHIEFHVESGFFMTLIEAPAELQEQSIPDDHISVCKAYPMLTEGNAGGDVDDPLNLTNANTAVPQENYGATYPPVLPGTSPERRRSSFPSYADAPVRRVEASNVY